MNRADYIGTVALQFLDDSDTLWQPNALEDVFGEELIKRPPNYLFTLGSGVSSNMVSLATTPAFQLPTNTQFYLAGRDVFRWGGSSDPYEIDFDRYGFTPDYRRGVAIVWKAPKSEPHHLSRYPQMLTFVPPDWKEVCEAILDRKL